VPENSVAVPARSSKPVLAPIVPGFPGRLMVELATALSSGQERSAILLSVVEVPEETTLSQGASPARRRRELLRRLGGEAELSGGAELEVRAARGFDAGVREAVDEADARLLILGWRGPVRSERRIRHSVLQSLIVDPPCDVAVFKRGRERGRESGDTGASQPAKGSWPPRRILVALRGGPHADLARQTAQHLARHFKAQLTELVVAPPGMKPPYQNAAPPTITKTVIGHDIEAILVAEAAEHDLLILGASARGIGITHMLGALPERVADAVNCAVLIVETSQPASVEMFNRQPLSLHSVSHPTQESISTLVDQWFAENTFHSHEFSDVRRLVQLKERQGLTISVALPALNEEATIGRIIALMKQRLMVDVPLIDEMVVIDSRSTDRTVDIAKSFDIPVHIHDEILPETGTFVGKGEALWKSLNVTKGDIVVWIDSDITDIHPKFVYGLVGPLLTQPRLGFVKGYYRRPLKLGGGRLTTGGGRVTELTARPLINLFYPQLSGLVQPLAGEMAGRRKILEQVPFFTGYGVETGLLIDLHERFGLDIIAQTDLENRIHRNQDMISLSKMAFGIIQVVIRRLEDRQHIRLLEEINSTMKLIHYSPKDLFLEVQEIREYEREPIVSVPAYADRWSPSRAAS
jgi:glycosyltransferase involved in cell wall biosynthesis/nucleotide-binding universal stress UspA family protein